MKTEKNAPATTYRRRTTGLGLLAVAVLVTTTACAAGGTASAEGETYSLTFGHGYATDTANHECAVGFAEQVSQLTDGALEIEIFPNSQIGTESELVQGLTLGSIDIADVSSGVLAVLQPEMGIFAAPYLFNNAEQQKSLASGDVGKRLYSDLESTAGITLLSTFFQPPRHLTSDVEVHSAEDVEGLKIRVPEIPIFTSYWSATNASPTPINFGELYTSLQQGVVNAQENPFVYIDSAKLYEVQEYLILTSHVRNFEWYAANTASLEKLPENLRNAVSTAGVDAQSCVNDKWSESDDELLQKFKDQGMTVIEPDVESFSSIMHESYESILPEELHSLYKEIRAINAAG
ncbi:TRAP transporter substrate-binding protein [Cryobacterium sp. Y62]|uniref:TRAP transporter substrate-binding protein n=1 Tax=Cryobacterium sp. Y62 TaxID=2048284 RepID=UPI0013049D65|nr:DctP family TRAP transporter solute-binding subunit [Cryobacterium sp. Y62]